MKNTRKIIAREFLIFIGVGIIILLSFIATYFYNSYLNKQIAKIEFKIESNQDFKKIPILSESYNQKWTERINLFDKASYNFNNVGFGKEIGNSQILWDRLKDKVKRNNIEKYLLSGLDFKNNRELKDFIEKNTIYQDEFDDYNLSLKLNNEKNLLEQKIDELKSNHLYNEDQQNIMIYTTIISFGIFFILRYLIISIIWSIKTLRSNT